MNDSEQCIDIDSVKWTDPGNLISLAVLGFVIVLVIVGNCLVIAAVFCSQKLRSVTNFFIVSLAVADLLVGLAVLPFSATREVFKVWIFGDLWCRIWLAVDVWMCTASILNLCAISLDRYVAVTRPVTYPSIMSTKRAKLLVAGVWILSFVICFPPLVSLIHPTQPKPAEELSHEGNQTQSIHPTVPCRWTCELNNDAGYVVYSALGSFYIPMFVMLFFYWRIYRAAVRTTRAINQGFKTTKGSSKENQSGGGRLTLRIHRGKRSNSVPRERRRSVPQTANKDLKISHSLGISTPYDRKKHPKQHERIIQDDCTAESRSPLLHMMQLTLNRQENMETFLYKSNSLRETCVSGCDNNSLGAGDGGEKTLEDGAVNTNGAMKRGVGKRILKVQAKRFRMETKAAKTLAIIVGGFICCWLPFFTIYLMRPFCHACTQPLLFSVLFWLGYCNSAINPLIYALFSKEFRFAFKRIICKCLCSTLPHRYNYTTATAATLTTSTEGFR